MYFSFHCNISTGELDFETPGGTYQVISINPEAQKFLIHRKNVLNCDQSSRDKFLPLNKSFPFHLTSNCYADPSIFSSNAPMKHGVEIELSWEQPLEPICSSLLDCKEWPNSTCNTSSDGKKRCLCNTNFLWDGLKLNCTLGNDTIVSIVLIYMLVFVVYNIYPSTHHALCFIQNKLNLLYFTVYDLMAREEF